MQITDKKEREQALDPGKSFIVQAPAGSGKTSLLIQRYLVLLANCCKVPEEILAITFTRKAAAEMRSRIFASLTEAQQLAPQDEHKLKTWQLANCVLEKNKKLKWQLLDNPNRLRIYTIDALCSYLTRQTPIISGLGINPNIIQNEELTVCYQQAVQNLLASLEDDPPYKDALADLLLHLDNDYQKAEKLLVAMLQKRDQWLPHIMDNSIANMETSLTNIINENIKKCLDSMPVDFMPREYIGNDLIKWQELASSLLTQKYTWRKRLDKNLLENLSKHEEFRYNLEQILRSPAPRYSEQQSNVINALCVILKVLVAYFLKAEFQKRGAVDYTEIALSALKALGENETPTNLTLKLDYKIQHILVDEFQDTSVTQYHLLEKLTMGWEQNDGRTLFLVGDPMQSIYKFREAKVGLFLKAKQHGINTIKLIPLTLKINFRSCQYLIDWNNIIFQKIFPNQDDIGSGAISFSVAAAVHKNTTQTQHVNIYAFADKDYISEAKQVIKIIKDKKAKNPDESIAVLVRNRSHLIHILPLLDIPYKGIELAKLSDSTVINDLFSLTKALLNPLDRIAWLAILRAPWCGLTLADLHVLAGKNHDQALRDILLNCSGEVTSDGVKRLTHLISVLEKNLPERYKKPPRQWIEDTWTDLDGHRCLHNAAELKEAQSYFKLLGEQTAEIDIALLEKQLMTLYSEPDPQADDSLQIMTIHKAKGLEFDTVIIPGLNSTPRRDDNSLLLWMERPSALANYDSNFILAPITANDGEHDSIYQYIKHEEKKKNYYETGRLLYVATTRARKSLHLLACVDDKPNKGSLLEQLWPNFIPTEPNQTVSGFPASAGNDGEQTLIRLPSDWKFKDYPITPPSECQWHWDLPDNSNRYIGTVIHTALEQYTAGNWYACAIKRRSIWRNQLIQLGTYDNLEQYIDIIEKALNNILNDPHGKWILDNNHEDAHSEYAVTLSTENDIKHYIIDRTFVENGIRWIIDYKTTTSTDISLEPYQEQLESYAKAMRFIDKKPINLAVYFPLLPKMLYYKYEN